MWAFVVGKLETLEAYPTYIREKSFRCHRLNKLGYNRWSVKGKNVAFWGSVNVGFSAKLGASFALGFRGRIREFYDPRGRRGRAVGR